MTSLPLRWERTARLRYVALGTKTVLEWCGRLGGYTATDPDTGAILCVDVETHRRYGQVRVFLVPGDGKTAVRKLVLARNAAECGRTASA